MTTLERIRIFLMGRKSPVKIQDHPLIMLQPSDMTTCPVCGGKGEITRLMNNIVLEKSKAEV